MPNKGDVHVVPSDKGWRVEVEGQSRAKGTHQTQQAAWQQAKQIAQQNRSEALLHGRSGQIRERNTSPESQTRELAPKSIFICKNTA
jgi:Uncharacterized protein conserved in bacteria (DUF2188)